MSEVEFIQEGEIIRVFENGKQVLKSNPKDLLRIINKIIEYVADGNDEFAQMMPKLSVDSGS